MGAAITGFVPVCEVSPLARPRDVDDRPCGGRTGQRGGVPDVGAKSCEARDAGAFTPTERGGGQRLAGRMAVSGSDEGLRVVGLAVVTSTYMRARLNL